MARRANDNPGSEHDDSHGNDDRNSNDRNSNDGRERESGGPPLIRVLRTARAEFGELTGLEAESVSSLDRDGEGWALQVEVLELSRIPDTMSLLATYEIRLDAEGHLTGYRRTRRYERGRADRS
ncbi:gas vesicle protein GvpO [Streptomyces sp. NPDC049577]|uniref:gas vesicle protein GvpO n=1 Tax=Streptomyces sp. NPDC049577 TaxID=3155153 RepID=UPI0034395075